MSKKRILFVDDQSEVRAALKRRLRPYRSRWDIELSPGGAEALETLASDPVDVIVTDMRMSGMQGSELLSRVHQDYPHIVRIVLSGSPDSQRVRQLVPFAHQFLSKPCDPEKLEEVINRTHAVLDMLTEDGLRRTVGRIKTLPSPPAIYNELTRLINDPAAGSAELSAVVEQDVAMTAKVLQIVNSAFFRLPREILRAEQAIQYLGGDMVKNIALAAEVFRDSNTLSPSQRSFVEEVRNHSLHVATVASRVAGERGLADRSFCAGVLHCIGLIATISEFPDVARINMSECCASPVPGVADGDTFVNHFSVGAYLLGIWGLPFDIIEAVGMHGVGNETFESLDVRVCLKLAELLISERASAQGAATEELEVLSARLNHSDELEGWRELVASTSALSETA